MRSQRRRRAATIALQLALSAGLLVGLWQAIDSSVFTSALGRAELWWLAPAAGANLLSDYGRALRWRVLLGRSDGQAGTGQLFGMILMSLAVNTIVPLRAGDVARVQLLGARGHRRTMVFGTLAGERLLDALTFAAVLAVAAFAGLGLGVTILAVVYIVAIALGFTLIFAVARVRANGAPAVGWAPGRLRETLRSQASAFLDGVAQMAEAGPLALAVFWSMASWFCEALVYVFVGEAMGLDLPFGAYLVVLVIANTAVAVPLTHAGIGPYEIGVTAIVVALGAARGEAAAYSVLVHAMVVVPIVVAGTLALWAMRVSPREVLYLRHSEGEEHRQREPGVP